MNPKDMPEPPNGTRVLAADTYTDSIIRHNVRYQRDDVRCETEAQYDDQRWFSMDGAYWSWDDVVCNARAIYLLDAAPAADRE